MKCTRVFTAMSLKLTSYIRDKTFLALTFLKCEMYWGVYTCSNEPTDLKGGISSSVLSVLFTDKFALSQSDASISVAYNSCQ